MSAENKKLKEILGSRFPFMGYTRKEQIERIAEYVARERKELVSKPYRDLKKIVNQEMKDIHGIMVPRATTYAARKVCNDQVNTLYWVIREIEKLEGGELNDN